MLNMSLTLIVIGLGLLKQMKMFPIRFFFFFFFFFPFPPPSLFLSFSFPHLPLQFELVEQLGEGAYGVVWRGVHKPTQLEAAVKLLPRREGMADEETMHEIEVLKKCHQANIVPVWIIGGWGGEGVFSFFFLVDYLFLTTVLWVFFE